MSFEKGKIIETLDLFPQPRTVEEIVAARKDLKPGTLAYQFYWILVEAALRNEQEVYRDGDGNLRHGPPGGLIDNTVGYRLPRKFDGRRTTAGTVSITLRDMHTDYTPPLARSIPLDGQPNGVVVYRAEIA